MRMPADIDIKDGILSTFGMVEYEHAICDIVKFLRSDDKADIPEWLGDSGEGWGKKFRIDTIKTINPALFAMLCGDGWITTGHFPKYAFTLSEAAIARLREHVPYAARGHAAPEAPPK